MVKLKTLGENHVEGEGESHALVWCWMKMKDMCVRGRYEL